MMMKYSAHNNYKILNLLLSFSLLDDDAIFGNYRSRFLIRIWIGIRLSTDSGMQELSNPRSERVWNRNCLLRWNTNYIWRKRHCTTMSTDKFRNSYPIRAKSSVNRTHFPALTAGCICLLYVLIGSAFGGPRLFSLGSLNERQPEVALVCYYKLKAFSIVSLNNCAFTLERKSYLALRNCFEHLSAQRNQETEVSIGYTTLEEPFEPTELSNL